jgi:diguanylate cyclase (GGDEF)-like protein/PAS domain S-box-containing protein
MEEKVTVLVVDDEPNLLRLNARLLKSAGYEVIEAETGERGLQLARSARPTLVLLDVMLPDISGLAVCSTIKSNPDIADIIVVLISSARIASAQQIEGYEAGADGYIARPIPNRELLARLQALIRLKNTEIELKRTQEELTRVRNTELVQTNAQLQLERDFIAAVLNTAGVLVIVMDNQGHIVRFNRACEQLTGYSFQDVAGRFLWDFLLLPEEIDPVRKVFEQLRAGEFPNQFENYWLARNGERRLIAWANTAIVGSTGSVEHVIGTGVDITERRQFDETMRLQSAALESAANAIVITDRRGQITWVNLAFTQLTGYNYHEALNRTPNLLKSGQHDDSFYRALWETILAGRVWHGELINRHKDGSLYCEEMTITPVKNAAGEITHFVAIKQDISARKHADEALQKALQDAQQVSERLGVMVGELERRAQEAALLNEMGDLLQTCNSAEEAYVVIGRYADQIFPGVSGAVGAMSPSRDLVEIVATWGNPQLGEEVFPASECWALRRGRLYTEEEGAQMALCHHLPSPNPFGCLCLPLIAQGEAMGILHLQIPSSHSTSTLTSGKADYKLLAEARKQLAIGIAERISLALANLRLRETLRDQASHDSLTGLYNRRFMQSVLEQETRRAARTATPLALIMLDIDHFKQFNDIHGHQAGDILLREMSSLLQHSVRTEDLVCRYGGEEFIVIMPGSNLANAIQRAEQLREKIKQLEIDIDADETQARTVTISLGVAALSERVRTADKLLRAADDALYQAKAGGRDRVMGSSEE